MSPRSPLPPFKPGNPGKPSRPGSPGNPNTPASPLAPEKKNGKNLYHTKIHIITVLVLKKMKNTKTRLKERKKHSVKQIFVPIYPKIITS